MQPRHPSHNRSSAEQRDHGRLASNPAAIPRKGWRDILLRTKERLQHNHLSIASAGVAFYLMAAIVPALAAFISIYGLVANPAQIQEHISSLGNFLPAESLTLIEDQITRISSQSKVAGWATVISVVISLWGCSSAMASLMEVLNIAYDEDEKRGAIRLRLTAILLALAAIAAGLFALFLIVALPAVLKALSIPNPDLWGHVIRWPVLLFMAITAFSLLYRYGPSRTSPKWRWVSIGSVVATALWLGGSALFTFYASHFGSYNKTYGSLAAVIILMMWLYLSAYSVGLGAELNAETEHQTARDSTSGPPRPMGERGAFVADDLGESK